MWIDFGSWITGIRIAFRAMSRNMLRASLTILGILVGIASVVTVTALSVGVRDFIGKKIESMGSNGIIIFPESSAASGAKAATGVRLSVDDGQAILSEVPTITAIAPILGSQAQLVNGDRNTVTGTVGTTIPYFQVGNWAFERGSSWSPEDEATSAKRIVIGATVAKALFGAEDPVGRDVRIQRYVFTVVGLLAAKGTNPFGNDQDDIVLMPISTARSHINRAPPGFAGALLASCASVDETEHSVKKIDQLLRQRHHIEEGRDADFAIHTQKELSDKQGFIFIILSTLLVLIAGISLVVGGIGVMNVMLVSVAERTREIGIRMAIGAREHDIRTQFLVEAIVLAGLGGVLGALVGIGAIYALEATLEWPMHLSPPALVISVAASGLTGIAFGFFPARRASRLDPIVALRHE